EGLGQQEQDAASRELSFLDRLALLVDQQWTWRQNQVLARRLKSSRLKGSACVENIDYRAERGLNRSVIRALAQDSAWVKNHEQIGDPTLADAILDRLVHNAHRIELRGESMRKQRNDKNV